MLLQFLAAVGGEPECGEEAVGRRAGHSLQRRVQPVPQPERGVLAARQGVASELGLQGRVWGETGDETGFAGVGPVLGRRVGRVERVGVEPAGPAEHMVLTVQYPAQFVG